MSAPFHNPTYNAMSFQIVPVLVYPHETSQFPVTGISGKRYGVTVKSPRYKGLIWPDVTRITPAQLAVWVAACGEKDHKAAIYDISNHRALQSPNVVYELVGDVPDAATLERLNAEIESLKTAAETAQKENDGLSEQITAKFEALTKVEEELERTTADRDNLKRQLTQLQQLTGGDAQESESGHASEDDKGGEGGQSGEAPKKPRGRPKGSADTSKAHG